MSQKGRFEARFLPPALAFLDLLRESAVRRIVRSSMLAFKAALLVVAVVAKPSSWCVLPLALMSFSNCRCVSDLVPALRFGVRLTVDLTATKSLFVAERVTGGLFGMQSS